MQIWVDADACTAVIRDILFRITERLHLKATLVANQLLCVPGSRFIRVTAQIGIETAVGLAQPCLLRRAQNEFPSTSSRRLT